MFPALIVHCGSEKNRIGTRLSHLSYSPRAQVYLCSHAYPHCPFVYHAHDSASGAHRKSCVSRQLSIPVNAPVLFPLVITLVSPMTATSATSVAPIIPCLSPSILRTSAKISLI